jgi:F-type H+-transporting ATPase subunit b
MLEEARRDADDLRAKEREAGTREAAAERDRAKREIDAAKDAALQEIYNQSVQLAALMSSKAIRRNMTADDHSRLVEEALAELKAGPTRN